MRHNGDQVSVGGYLSLGDTALWIRNFGAGSVSYVATCRYPGGFQWLLIDISTRFASSRHEHEGMAWEGFDMNSVFCGGHYRAKAKA